MIANLYGVVKDEGGLKKIIKSIPQKMKYNKEMRIIVKKLKDDQQVQQFIENPNKRGWQKMLANKLSPQQLKYIKRLYKRYFKDYDKKENYYYDKQRKW